jgi:hypothetical protein
MLFMLYINVLYNICNGYSKYNCCCMLQSSSISVASVKQPLQPVTPNKKPGKPTNSPQLTKPTYSLTNQLTFNMYTNQKQKTSVANAQRFPRQSKRSRLAQSQSVAVSHKSTPNTAAAVAAAGDSPDVPRRNKYTFICLCRWCVCDLQTPTHASTSLVYANDATAATRSPPHRNQSTRATTRNRRAHRPRRRPARRRSTTHSSTPITRRRVTRQSNASRSAHRLRFRAFRARRRVASAPPLIVVHATLNKQLLLPTQRKSSIPFSKVYNV